MAEETLMKVAPDLHGLRTAIVNLYFWGTPGQNARWVLIDGGVPGCSAKIFRAAAQLFGENVPPVAIVLTHAHFDHVGAITDILKRWAVPLYCHPLELPFVTGKADYPRPDPTVNGGMMSFASPLFPRHRYDFGAAVKVLPGNGDVPEMPGWEWFHTPGHTPGHVSLFRMRDRLVVAGDAFVTVRQESAIAVMQQRVEVRPPPAYFTLDWSAAYESIRRLRSLEPLVAATGHGQPLRGEKLTNGLRTLESRFEEIGLPKHGRYVRETWKMPRTAAA